MPHASSLIPHASCLLLQPTMQATNGSAKTSKRPRRSISAIRTSLLLTCPPQILANHASDQRKRQNPQTTAAIHQCDTHRYAQKKSPPKTGQTSQYQKASTAMPPEGQLEEPIISKWAAVAYPRNPGWQAHPALKFFRLPDTWSSVLQIQPIVAYMAEACRHL